MADMFNRQTDQFGGSFIPDGLFINFAGGGAKLVAPGMVVQALGWNYAQRAALLFEVGSPRSYFIGGRTEGQVTMQRVIGPTDLGRAFIQTFGDLCKVNNNSLTISSSNGFCAGAGQVKGENYKLDFCLITNVSNNVQANDNIMNQTITMMFASGKLQ